MTAVIYAVLHRLRHGHLPIWRKTDYDFLSFRWSCVVCERRPLQEAGS